MVLQERSDSTLPAFVPLGGKSLSIASSASDFDWSLEQMGDRVQTVLDTLALDRNELHPGPARVVKLVSTYAD